MSTIVIMPGGFHPFHAGHAALYQSARKAFPGAKVFVAATNDTSTRPFPFAIKEKLARLAGVQPGHFVQVKSPFRAEEITSQFDPEKDRLIFVRSEKDASKPPQAGGNKKDGSPAYLQPLAGQTNIRPFAEHAYMAYLPTVEFGPGMTSATEIRTAWPTLDARRKTALVMSLYPKTQINPKLAATVVKMLDTAMGSDLTESGMLGHVMFRSKPPKLKKIQPAASRTKDFMKKDFSISEDEEVDEDISRRGFLKGAGAAAAAGAAGKASAIAGAFPTPSHQAAMYKAAADSNAAQARADAAAKAKADAERLRTNTELVDKEQRVNHHKLDEFAPDEGGGSRKFIPWPEFIDAVKQIVGKDFSVKENVVKSTIKARFIPHDPMEYGPTMLYSYYETRAGGRNKGAVSTRGSIQVGKYFDKGSYFNSSDPDIQNQLLTSFNLLKGHPFERHFDLTFDNIYKIANIIMGNTEGAYQMQPQQGVAEMDGQNFVGGMTASYQARENQPVDESSDYMEESSRKK